ncbi:hypothetical protein H0H93_015408 [Arthromyces matolae]|nr:hypothetical protein H0H93_015408 [Arthromyces matolae]
MPGRTLQAGAAALREKVVAQVSRILEQVQATTANHQKNVVALYKIHEEAAEYKELKRDGMTFKLIGEKLFEEVMIDMIMRVLPVKKGVPQADRIVKFYGEYIKSINMKAADEPDDEEAEGDELSMEARFTARLLNFYFKGFLSKDKSVRFRVLQCVAEMVSHLGEIDHDIYTELRSSLMDRINDREVPVRVQAVIALSKLAGTEEPDEVEEGEQSVQELLLDVLKNDSSAEVRRAALLNLHPMPTTIPAILDRMRDTDTTMRKLVYSAVLEKHATIGDTDEMGPTHPRALTIAQREQIIRSGLGDREPTVRAAAAALLGIWVDVVAEQPQKIEDEDTKPDVQVESGLVEMLKMLDLAEQKYPVDAVLSVFTTRPEIFETMEFGPAYWSSLTPEKAFLARVFVEHGRATNDNTRLEAVLPVVTELAFRLQESFNELAADIHNQEDAQLFTELSDDDKTRMEDARLEKEAIIGELLQLAVNLDYSDEIGRRKMFQLVRDILMEEVLPVSLLNKCLDVVRELSNSERDLIRLVVELVQDLRDRTRDDDEEELNKDDDAETNFGDTPATVRPPRRNPPRERTTEEIARADATDLKCLLLCIGMLERVNGTLEENTTLEGILQELIIPSVKRKDFLFREKGLISLGLCCLIAKVNSFDIIEYTLAQCLQPLAINSVKFFVDQVQPSPAKLQGTLLQIVFDIIMVHEPEFQAKRPEIIPHIIEQIRGILGSAVDEKVLALVCLGLSKLVLAGIITDDQIFLDAYKTLKNDRETLEDDEEMISPAQIATLFTDWTDPNKLRHAVDAQGKTDVNHQANMSIQLEMASDILKALLEKKWDKDDTKVLCQCLPKLHIPGSADDDTVKTLKVLIHAIRSRRPIRDTTTNNAFTKFETAITKKFAKQLEDFSEEEYRKLEQLEDLFQFVDSIIPQS